MANEVMAKALSGIDDELIVNAYKASTKKRNLKPLYSISAIAACLVLIFTAMFALPQKSTQIYLYSEKVTHIPCIVNQPSALSSLPRTYSQDLSIPLDVKLAGETKITCSQGTIAPCGENQDCFYYTTGNTFLADKDTAKNPLSLLWTIESPDETKTYTLTLEGKKTEVLTLSFDEESLNWTIFIEK